VPFGWKPCWKTVAPPVYVQRADGLHGSAILRGAAQNLVSRKLRRAAMPGKHLKAP